MALELSQSALNARLREQEKAAAEYHQALRKQEQQAVWEKIVQPPADYGREKSGYALKLLQDNDILKRAQADYNKQIANLGYEWLTSCTTSTGIIPLPEDKTMKLYTVAAIYKPKDEDNEGDRPEIVLVPNHVLAKDEAHARVQAARAIPVRWERVLDQIEVLVRPF
jgi:hypothetical protein